MLTSMPCTDAPYPDACGWLFTHHIKSLVRSSASAGCTNNHNCRPDSGYHNQDHVCHAAGNEPCQDQRHDAAVRQGVCCNCWLTCMQSRSKFHVVCGSAGMQVAHTRVNSQIGRCWGHWHCICELLEHADGVRHVVNARTAPVLQACPLATYRSAQHTPGCSHLHMQHIQLAAKRPQHSHLLWLQLIYYEYAVPYVILISCFLPMQENAKLDMASEMVGDAIDDALDNDEAEDETNELVDQVRGSFPCDICAGFGVWVFVGLYLACCLAPCQVTWHVVCCFHLLLCLSCGTLDHSLGLCYRCHWSLPGLPDSRLLHLLPYCAPPFSSLPTTYAASLQVPVQIPRLQVPIQTTATSLDTGAGRDRHWGPCLNGCCPRQEGRHQGGSPAGGGGARDG